MERSGTIMPVFWTGIYCQTTPHRTFERSFKFLLLLTAVLAPQPSRARGQFGGRTIQPLMARFDKDGDKKLNAAERKTALDYLGWGGGTSQSSSKAKIPPGSVAPVPSSTPLYDPATIRTLFLEFEDTNWERERKIYSFGEFEQGRAELKALVDLRRVLILGDSQR
jgi:hypothetical protein